MFDNIFYSIFNKLKPRFGRKANNLAILYISILQLLIVMVIGVFLKAFFSNMNSNFLSDEKISILFILATIFIFFKNWIQYSGKKRKVKNSKVNHSNSKAFGVYGLILFPVGCIVLLLILNQAI
ncbi:hypothetical protein SAMN03097699_2485 [Flavobacteriaceae bacterium MAR_2010_188]|nr:hypothetical protein SAMN03097699_2485 [Flavobacteriaceae bacterium MAR_2010_188]